MVRAAPVDDGIRVTIRDQGVGFDPSLERKGFGLEELDRPPTRGGRRPSRDLLDHRDGARRWSYGRRCDPRSPSSRTTPSTGRAWSRSSSRRRDLDLVAAVGSVGEMEQSGYEGVDVGRSSTSTSPTAKGPTPSRRVKAARSTSWWSRPPTIGNTWSMPSVPGRPAICPNHPRPMRSRRHPHRGGRGTYISPVLAASLLRDNRDKDYDGLHPHRPGTGNPRPPGRRGDRRRHRRASVHQREHRQIPPRPHPGQDGTPASCRTGPLVLRSPVGKVAG